MIRNRLLDVGLAAFARRGYHGTGLKEIVDTAQIPKGSFYNYFKSKEDFCVAIIERHSADFWQKWHDGINEHDDPMQTIKNCFDRMLTDYCDCTLNTCYVVAHLVTEICEDNSDFSGFMMKIFQEWSDNLAQLIRKAQQAGAVRTDVDAAQLATTFWDAWHGAMLRVKVEKPTLPLKQLVTLTFDVLLKP